MDVVYPIKLFSYSSQNDNNAAHINDEGQAMDDTWSFIRRLLFGAQSGCNRYRRVRVSQCARLFEVFKINGREYIYNIQLLICYKGGALWDHWYNVGKLFSNFSNCMYVTDLLVYCGSGQYTVMK